MFNFPLVLRSGDFTRYCAWKYVNREIPLGVLVNLAKTMHGNALPRRYLMNSKTRGDMGQLWVKNRQKPWIWGIDRAGLTRQQGGGEVACLHILEWFISLPFLVLVPTYRQTYWK